MARGVCLELSIQFERGRETVPSAITSVATRRTGHTCCLETRPGQILGSRSLGGVRVASGERGHTTMSESVSLYLCTFVLIAATTSWPHGKRHAYFPEGYGRGEPSDSAVLQRLTGGKLQCFKHALLPTGPDSFILQLCRPHKCG